MASRVTSKGQVTIPKRVRDALGIKPGSVVDFDMDSNGNIVLVKTGNKRRKSRFESIRGRFRGRMSTDQIMALLRGDD